MKKIALNLLVIGLAFGISCSTETNNESTVFVTNTGNCYHEISCRYLGQSYVPISITRAIERGYDPCTSCHPITKPVSNGDTERKIGRLPTPQNRRGSKSVRCSAITKKGLQCKRMTTNVSEKCFQHDNK